MIFSVSESFCNLSEVTVKDHSDDSLSNSRNKGPVSIHIKNCVFFSHVCEPLDKENVVPFLFFDNTGNVICCHKINEDKNQKYRNYCETFEVSFDFFALRIIWLSCFCNRVHFWNANKFFSDLLFFSLSLNEIIPQDSQASLVLFPVD